VLGENELVRWLRNSLKAQRGFNKRHWVEGLEEVSSATSGHLYVQYRATCRCGWRGPLQDSRTSASGDGQDHLLSAFRERRRAADEYRSSRD
jgi:hypothetical protein